jgi:hypothetical protein
MRSHTFRKRRLCQITETDNTLINYNEIKDGLKEITR